MTGGVTAPSAVAFPLLETGIGAEELGALDESEIAAEGGLSELDPTDVGSAGASLSVGKAVGASGCETIGASMPEVTVAAGGTLENGMIVEGKDGGPLASAWSRFGRAGKLAGAEAAGPNAGASGSHAGFSGAVVGKERAGAATSFEALVPGKGGTSEMLPRRGLESLDSGSDGTLSAV